MAPVLRNLNVDEFGDSGQRYAGAAYADALATAKTVISNGDKYGVSTILGSQSR